MSIATKLVKHANEAAGFLVGLWSTDAGPVLDGCSTACFGDEPEHFGVTALVQ